MFPGNHQLEVAQLNIKLRDAMAELEEVQFTCSQHHIVPGSSSSTEGEGGSGREGTEEHIYDEPPEEVSTCTCMCLSFHLVPVSSILHIHNTVGHCLYSSTV